MKKTLFLLIAVCLPCMTMAQSPLQMRGRVLQLDTNGNDVLQRWKKLDTSNFTAGMQTPFPDTTGNSAKFLRGDLSWQTAGGGSPYFKDDGGIPSVAPIVSASTKSFSIGDGTQALYGNDVAFGNGTRDSGVTTIAIGRNNIVNSGTSLSIVIGDGNHLAGMHNILIGDGGNIYSPNGGKNTVIGYGAFAINSTTAYSSALGASANVYGAGDIAIGHSECAGNHEIVICGGTQSVQARAGGDYATLVGDGTGSASQSAHHVTFLGANVGKNLAGNYDTGLGAFGAASQGSFSAFDSTVQIGCYADTARNAGEFLCGTGMNNTGTNYAFQLGLGGVYGNPAFFDGLSVNFDGTVTAGKNFASTLRTVTNSTDTGTQGEICYDANFIYICTATNTWKRVAIATW